MNAVNAVQLFILVCTFTAVCQADDDDSVSCEDVTGAVRNEVTLTCSVSLHRSECCIKLYKFKYPEKYNDSEICKQEFPQGSCDQRNRFTCSFTPTTVMTEQFRFFVQTQCGAITTEFTVNITEPIKPETDPEDHDKKEEPQQDKSSQPEIQKGRGFKVAVIAAAVSCFIIVIIPIIYKMKQNYKQKRMLLCFRQDEDINNSPENVIECHSLRSAKALSFV